MIKKNGRAWAFSCKGPPARFDVVKGKIMNNFAGYEWGWINTNGERVKLGVKVMPKEIAGIWSIVKRSDIEMPFYHEVFLEEYKADKGSWGERPITMLLKLAQIQAYKFAYADETSLSLPDEIIALPGLFEKTTEKLQLWRCQTCGHEFYTPLGAKEIWYKRLIQRVLGLFGRPVYINCQVCSSTKAVKVRIVTKNIRE